MAQPVTIAPPAVITPPGFLPPIHSLLATAQPGPELSPHEEAGFTFEVSACGIAHARPTLCLVNSNPVNPVGGLPYYTGGKPENSVDQPGTPVVYQPFEIEASYDCAAFGKTFEERQELALRTLANAAYKAVEREFWTGESGYGNQSLAGDCTADAGIGGHPGAWRQVLNPGFNSTTAPNLTGVTAVPVNFGVALLSQALADCGNGARGAIHVTPMVAEMLSDSRVVAEGGRTGEVLRTWGRGDYLVVGSGYPGTGPCGDVPGSGKVWIHATKLPVVRFGPSMTIEERLGQALDRADNTITVHATQTAAVYHDGCCPAFSVLVDIAAKFYGE